MPLPETVIAPGDVFAKIGKTDEAQKQYDLVEIIEQKLNNTDQRRLALLWTDHDIRLDEALEIATSEHVHHEDHSHDGHTHIRTTTHKPVSQSSQRSKN